MVLRLICIAFLLLLSCGEPSFDNPTDPRNVSHPDNIDYGSFTDGRDKKTYKKVVIGTQTWMAENLNYNSTGSRCIDNVERNGIIKDTLVSNGGYCNIYGRLYDYETANKACPEGWHLPSSAEWDLLLSYASWKELKSKKGWKTLLQGTDIYGFTALPGGYGRGGVGLNAYWWSATKEDASNAYLASTENSNTITNNISNFYSVRCLYSKTSTSSSSSLVVPSSSSKMVSSSSSMPSSSSSIASSSSSVPSSSSACTAEDNDYYYYCSNGTIKEYDFVTDEDGQEYKTVKIGTQTWMAENLNYDVEGSICYDDYYYNCYTYGRLYNWITAMALPSKCNSQSCADLIAAGVKDICPIGWHIPSDEDWNKLISAVGGSSAGIHLKTISEWKREGAYNGNGKDTYGFSAMPGGYGAGGFYEDFSGIEDFDGIEDFGGWWSSSENAQYTKSSYKYMRYDAANVSSGSADKTELYYSIRCVMDD